MQLAPRIFACKSPLDLGACSISLFFQLLDLTSERFFIPNAPVKTLTTEDAQLDLSYILDLPRFGGSGANLVMENGLSLLRKRTYRNLSLKESVP